MVCGVQTWRGFWPFCEVQRNLDVGASRSPNVLTFLIIGAKRLKGCLRLLARLK